MPRRKLDFYETPPHYVEALLRKIRPRGLILEPCAGDGAIAKYLNPIGSQYSRSRIVTNDIDRKRRADYHLDAAATNPESYMWQAGGPWDWVITNPPFNRMLPIVINALNSSRNVAMLARLSFLEPTKARYTQLWSQMALPTHTIVLPRYSFRLNDKGKRGSDSVTCCWLIWEEGDPATISFVGKPKR